MDLQNKTAFITGGGSGLGLATARLLVANGARVMLFDRNADALGEAAAELGMPVGCMPVMWPTRPRYRRR